MPRTKNTITKKDGYSMGKSVSNEESVLSHIIGMVKTQAKAYYIIWKYAPELLPNPNIKTFEDLTSQYKTFTKGMTAHVCKCFIL